MHHCKRQLVSSRGYCLRGILPENESVTPSSIASWLDHRYCPSGTTLEKTPSVGRRWKRDVFNATQTVVTAWRFGVHQRWRCYSEEISITTSDQQCSPVVRYWRKCSRRTEMGIQSEDVTRSARFKPWLPLEVWFCLTAKTMLRGVQHRDFGTTVFPSRCLMSGRSLFGVSKHHRSMSSKRRVISQSSVSVWSSFLWCQ